MSTLSQLPTRLTMYVCVGILSSALILANAQLEIVISILTLVLIILLLREDFGSEMRPWMMLALGTYATGVVSDLLDEIPELKSHWFIVSTDNVFMHIGTFLICFCFIKLINQRKELIIKLNKQIQIARQLEGELSQLALEDDLTGLMNRRALFRCFDRMAIENRRGVLAYIDIDNFKQVNDRLGHKPGDELLCTISRALIQTAPAGSKIYRIGGDEFVVLLPEDSKDSPQDWLNQLYDHTQATRVTFNIGLSVGLSPYYPGNLSDPDAILAKADRAMYQEKEHKKYL
ncbi:GGDEF domain-containing protein [Photobacterium ganghwense]|uniref:diguanylate cyclase n=1 Tax=Photobacterium ganghwense TaxID=320778 RepID=A0A0J1H874_9GAMM|nr:GGDEF domain-containing protein [Photobacterium ganghwense]KLV07876.1 diguanylate cyclase/phosphodiesterase [Photobacterium ganghwense]PSU06974.1 GGDEF domain-containing protein [Photobacterium ganghwense]QSV15728.1 GGDEF domain-containing protein [Photobacterium ganghwense]